MAAGPAQPSAEELVGLAWILQGVLFAMLLQVGHAFLQLGYARKDSSVFPIKTVLDLPVATIAWYLLGAGFALGKDEYPDTGENGFIGTDGFALSGSQYEDNDDYLNESAWILQLGIVWAAVSIYSSAVGERIATIPHFTCVALLAGWIVPVQIHWVWSKGGFASSIRDADLLFKCGGMDAMGAGPAFIGGGMFGLMACTLLGARRGRFGRDHTVEEIPPLSQALQAIGTLFLWMSWVAIGVAMTYLYGGLPAASRAAVNLVLAGAVSSVVATVIGYARVGAVVPMLAAQGAIAGVASVSAGASVMPPYIAFVVGIVGGLIYYFGAALMLVVETDDVTNALSGHVACGVWSLLATGLFAHPDYMSQATNGEHKNDCCGAAYGCSQSLLLANFVLLVVAVVWNFIWATGWFAVLERFKMLRATWYVLPDLFIDSLLMPAKRVLRRQPSTLNLNDGGGDGGGSGSRNDGSSVVNKRALGPDRIAQDFRAEFQHTRAPSVELRNRNPRTEQTRPAAATEADSPAVGAGSGGVGGAGVGPGGGAVPAHAGLAAQGHPSNMSGAHVPPTQDHYAMGADPAGMNDDDGYDTGYGGAYDDGAPTGSYGYDPGYQ